MIGLLSFLNFQSPLACLPKDCIVLWEREFGEKMDISFFQKAPPGNILCNWSYFFVENLFLSGHTHRKPWNCSTCLSVSFRADHIIRKKGGNLLYFLLSLCCFLFAHLKLKFSPFVWFLDKFLCFVVLSIRETGKVILGGWYGIIGYTTNCGVLAWK